MLFKLGIGRLTHYQMKFFYCVLYLILLLITTACSPILGTGIAESATPTPVLPTATTQPTPIQIEPPTATPDPLPQRTHYELNAVFQYAQRELVVEEKIRYTNRSIDQINELILAVEANQSAGVFSLNSATWADNSSIEGIGLEDVKLTLPLRVKLQPGDEVAFSLFYSISLPQKAGVLSFSDRQVNVSGWYPYVVPYINGNGWLLHSPGVVGEYQVSELADFNVTLKLEDTPANFTLAASGIAVFDQDGFHFKQKGVRNFTWSGSSEYSMLEAYAGDVRVRAFVFPEHQTAGQASLDATVQALNLYANLYGPYTRESLTIVEGTFPDEMEYDGLYFLGQAYFTAYTGNPASYLVTLSAHETAHQWWYAMTTNDQALEPWLDEALCTYSESLFYENEYPELVSWWWTTRVQYYSPQGGVNRSIYDFTAFRPYVNAVYLRGAEFLEEVRTTVGEEAYFAFMKDYFTSLQSQSKQDALGLSTGDIFWLILSRHTTVDISVIKSHYFQGE